MHIINSKPLNLSEIMLEQLGGLFKIIFWLNETKNYTKSDDQNVVKHIGLKP